MVNIWIAPSGEMKKDNSAETQCFGLLGYKSVQIEHHNEQC